MDSLPGRPIRAAGTACDTASHAGSIGPNCTMTDTEIGPPTKSGLVGAAHRRRPCWVPMGRRDTEESHRAATPLELLFDLCFVVAVSQAGTQLNDALSVGHYQSGIVGFFMVFFAIWWAWVNFTWFASAYDVDDLLYRLLTFVQIVGVLDPGRRASPTPSTMPTSPSSRSATWSCAWPWWANGCGPPPVTPQEGRWPCTTRSASASARSAGSCASSSRTTPGSWPSICWPCSKCWCRRGPSAGAIAPARRGIPGTSTSATACSPSSCSASASPPPPSPSTTPVPCTTSRPPPSGPSSVGRCSWCSRSGGGTSSTRPRRGCACRGARRSSGATATTSSSRRSPRWAQGSSWRRRARTAARARCPSRRRDWPSPSPWPPSSS